MSVRVMSWVWQHSRSRKNERLVLLAISDCASDDGANAYPSMAELVRKTGLSERGVQSSISSLVTLGELFVGRNMGPRGCNRYRVIMRDPADPAPPQNLHPAKPAVSRKAEGSQRKASPPQILHPPADPAPPQSVRSDPAESAPGTVLEPSENKISSSKRSPASRGSRIPDDFTVTPEMRDWAKEHVPQLAGRGETEKFIDHFRSASGSNAAKRDWVAAWRNWMRRAAERAPGSALATTGQSRPSTTDRRFADAQALKAKFGEVS